MRKLHLLRIVPGVLLLASVSCLFDPPSYPVTGDIEQEFQLFFENHDRLYSGFSVRPEVNWYALHDQYEARLDTVSSHDGLMLLIRDMLSHLEDANITVISDYALYDTWEPVLAKNYDIDLIFELLDPWGGITWVGESDSIFGYAFVNDSIPYLFMDGTPFSSSEFDYIFEEFKESPGMIIDVRMLDTGNSYMMDMIVKRFADLSRIVYYTVYRNGPGHDDFSDPTQVRRSRRGGWQFNDRPVILLAGESNRGYAVAFVQMLRQFPNVTVIGDMTSGILAENATFTHNDNSFVTFPVTAYLDTEYEFIDRVGVPPDIYVEATEADFQMGIDPIYDYALELLTN